MVKRKYQKDIDIDMNTIQTTKNELEKAGLKCVGTSPDNKLVEIVELKEHPFYVGCQFHPEFKSRPNRPHPLFDGFVKSLFNEGWTI